MSTILAPEVAHKPVSVVAENPPYGTPVTGLVPPLERVVTGRMPAPAHT
ncbi:hypothetical protein [Streptomyces sp. NPDC001450]